MKQAGTNRNSVGPKTDLNSFCQVTPEGQMLLQVAPGVSIMHALEKASCLLNVARDLCADIGHIPGDELEADISRGDPRNAAWASTYLLEIAGAIVESCASGAMQMELSAGEGKV